MLGGTGRWSGPSATVTVYLSPTGVISAFCTVATVCRPDPRFRRVPYPAGPCVSA
jgi:hypothetical protein